MKKLLLIGILSTTLFADKVNIGDILKLNYSENVLVTKKSLLLTKEEVKSIQKEVGVKIKSKIVRLYKIEESEKIVGYGILLKRKIRTKNAAVLYMLDNNQSIKAIEIVSFTEPLEYKPNKSWQDVFKGKTSKDMLISGKDIPTISGATLSARSITDMSRLAIAIAKRKVK
jgi:hypothetical protein